MRIRRHKMKIWCNVVASFNDLIKISNDPHLLQIRFKRLLYYVTRGDVVDSMGYMVSFLAVLEGA